jgi:hypothetical protein
MNKKRGKCLGINMPIVSPQCKNALKFVLRNAKLYNALTSTLRSHYSSLSFRKIQSTYTPLRSF